MNGLPTMLGRWPVTLRVPLLVALLMVVVSAVISERVLTRLAETQSRHLSQLTDAYLDGLSSSLLPVVLHRDVWETFDKLDRAGELYGGLQLVRTVVTDADGAALASSDPREIATGAQLSESFLERFPETGLRTDIATGRAYLIRPMLHQERQIGAIYAIVDTSHLLRERREVLTQLVITNATITLLLALFGYVAVKRMVRPLRVLADRLQAGGQGDVEPIREPFPQSHEARRLFAAYNTLVDAVGEREALARRLAEEQRHASLGRLASGMAHEINNPLGGMFNALDTLKRHGDKPDARMKTIDLLERGLLGIRQVVGAALVTYRSDEPSRPLRHEDLEDIRLLAGPELRRRSVALNWTNEIDDKADISAASVRQIVLNLILNACSASPSGSVVAFAARSSEQSLIITVDDSGPGMPDDASIYLTAKALPDRPMGSGSRLGLWLVRRLAHELGACIDISESELGGARIRLTVPVVREEELAHVA